MKNIILALALSVLPFAPAHAHEGHDGETPRGHLSFENGLYHAHLSFEAGPLVTEESVLRVEFKDGATHAPIAGPAVFRVWVNMPDMDHESPETLISPVTDEKGEAILGSFRVNDVYFIMGGLWNVNIAVVKADGTEEIQAWSLPVGADEGDGGHHGQH